MKCRQIDDLGRRCRANAMREAEYCYFHNPAISKEEKRLATVRGGLAKERTVKEPLEPIAVEKVSDVKFVLIDTINRVRSGEMDFRIGNCLGSLCGYLLRAFELVEFESRFETIEKIVLEKKTFKS